MWTVISNPIVSHVLAALVGGGAAWYAGHRTAAKSIETAISATVTALKADATKAGAAVGAATTAIKKDV
jgi:hypothetical protein